MTGFEDREATVLVVDEEEAFVSSTAALLEKEGYRSARARNAEEAMRVLRSHAIDVLIADIGSSGGDDLQLLREARRSLPLLPVILVTAQPSVQTAVGALRLAVVDYLTKPCERGQFMQTVRTAIARGHAARDGERLRAQLASWVGMQLFDQLPAGIAAGSAGPPRALHFGADGHDDLAGLSHRERQILESIAMGLRVAAIAGALGISMHTVRNHLKSIFRKLGVHSQVELLGRLRRRETASGS